MLHHVFDVLHAAGALTHDLRGEVRVATGAVPVGEKLRLEADGETEGLADAAEQVPRQPHVIADLDAEARPDLVLPLARHDLRIRPGDFDAGVQTGLVVQVSDLPAEADVATDGAVVRALLSRVA